jgi:hypothetical protein
MTLSFRNYDKSISNNRRFWLGDQNLNALILRILKQLGQCAN